MSAHHPVSDWGRLLALTGMWGSAFLLTKVALAGILPELVVAGRLAIACLVLVPLALTIDARGGERTQWSGRLWLFMILIGLFGNVLPFNLIAWGQQRMDSGLAGILMAVMPLATLGLAHVFVPGERLTVYRIGGFLAGFAGVVVLMLPQGVAAGAPAGDPVPPLAMLAVLAGALCYAISAVLARLRPPSHPLPSAALTTLIATGIMLPWLLLPGGIPDPDLPSGSSLLAVLALGLFSTAWASVIYFGLIRSAGPAFVSQLNYLIPLWAVGIGVVFLGEEPRPSQLLALALILGGILFTRLERRPRAVVDPAGGGGG